MEETYKEDLYERVYGLLSERRERVLSGKINCIPWGLPRFEEINPGIEQGKYYLITANSKVGKTQITDWLFLYNTISQIIDKKLNVRLKIFYFTLEMSKEEKMIAAFSNIIYVKTGVRISPTDLKSTKADKVLPKEHLDLIKEFEPYFRKIEEVVTFIDSVRNPTGIYKFMRNYARNNGTQHTQTVQFTNNETGELYDQEIDDYYEPNDPEEYVMCIIDHISLIMTETIDGYRLNLHQSISKLSSDYLVRLRNKYGYIPVVIQQQSSAQESIENAKLDRLRPTLDGLGDNKTTQRDANLILGLFSPFRHKIKSYMDYNIEYFRDNIRFLEILGGRDGGGGTICPLYFDGAVNFFKELPRPDDAVALNAVYKFLTDSRKQYKF